MIKTTNKKKVTFYLEAKQHEDLKRLSLEKGMSIGLLIRLAVKEFTKIG